MKRGPYRTKPTPYSVTELVRLYRQSPRVRAWAPSTARVFDRFLHDFERRNGPHDVRALRRGDIIAMRDSLATTPGAARNWLKTIRGLLDYALDLEWITVNPAASVKPLPMANPDGHATWTEVDIDRFLGRWRLGTSARRALLLMLYTGAARADVVRLGWQHVTADGSAIQYRRQKMERRGGPLVTVPILPELAAELATWPRDRMTFLETQHRRPRSDKTLTEDMRRWCAAAGLPPGLTNHGLRKALARRLAESGATPAEMMAVLGHRSIAMSAFYASQYDRAGAAASGMEKLSGHAPNVTRLRRK